MLNGHERRRHKRVPSTQSINRQFDRFSIKVDLDD